MSEPPLPPPLPPIPVSPLVRDALPANLVRNRIEILQTAEAVFRKYGHLVPDLHKYLKEILFLGRNINRFVMDLELPEQAIWFSKHKNMFDPVFPGIERYEAFLPILIKIMVLDQTTLYTHDLLMHLMVLLIGEELTHRGEYSERAVEQIGQKFMYLLDIIREFFRRRNICLDVLSSSLTLDPRMLESATYRGSITFLIQFVAVDEMNVENTWRALYILARQEHHIANLLKASAEHQVEKGETDEIRTQAKKDAARYFEVATRLEDFLKTLADEIAENSEIKRLEAEKGAANTKAKKNAANAAKAEAERMEAERLLAATAAAEQARKALLNEEEAAKAVAAGKAEKEKRKREEKAARKAAEKAEADRIAAAEAAEKAAAAAAAKAEADRIAAEKKVAKNSVKKSSNLLAASMKKRAPELMTPVRTPLILKKPSASPPAPSPASLPPSVSPTNSISPPLPPAPAPSVVALPPSVSPPNLSNAPRIPTPSLAKTGFTPYSRPPPVVRFWEMLDHRYIYQILNDIFIGTQNPNTRFYLKGSAAIHLYKRAHRIALMNHTSDYDATLLLNPGLAKKPFYELRSYMLNSIIQRLTAGMNDPRFNAEVITKLHAADIPFASSYWDVGMGKTVYNIKDTIPQEYVGVPDKSGPRFYTDTMNQYPYASHAAKPSTNILNMRIIRTLVKPKNVTVLQLYTKTSPEIKLIEVTVPFYEYDENETQISLAAQWAAAAQVNVIDGVPVLSLPALKAEQQKLRTLKEAAEIDRRIADINTLMQPAGGAGSGSSVRRRTRKLR